MEGIYALLFKRTPESDWEFYVSPRDKDKTMTVYTDIDKVANVFYSLIQRHGYEIDSPKWYDLCIKRIW